MPLPDYFDPYIQMHLFVDNLTNVDFSYLHPTRGLLGETWLANVGLDGALDATGMVCDFGVVKQILRDWLDIELDHRLLVPLRSPHLNYTIDGDRINLSYQVAGLGTITTTSPLSAVALVDVEEITPIATAAWSVAQLQRLFPDTVDRLTLNFSEEPISGPFYHYSHGLKKHDGNCQRIAHGHRSRIDIWRNGDPAPELEQSWADLWRDIYIGTQEDLVGEAQHAGIDCYQFAYQAQQGSFELSLPKACCYLIDSDSTVENIATHIAQALKAQANDSLIRVKAFEGIGKGAIAEA